LRVSLISVHIGVVGLVAVTALVVAGWAGWAVWAARAAEIQGFSTADAEVHDVDAGRGWDGAGAGISTSSCCKAAVNPDFEGARRGAGASGTKAAADRVIGSGTLAG